MATTLETLQVVITGSAKGLVSAYDQATKATKSFSAASAKHTEAIRSGVNKIGGAAMGIVAPLAAAATAFAGFKAVMDSFAKADTLGRTSAALGITTTNLGKLHYAAALSQSSAEELDRGLQKMTMFIGEAGKQGSEAQQTLQRLGLTIASLEGQTADEAFGTLSDALNDVQSGGDRASLGMKVFGETSHKLVGVIGAGSAGLKELGDEGVRTGRVMTAIDFSNLMAAKDSMEKLGTAMSALSDRIAIALAPLIDWISKGINDWIGDTKAFDATFTKVANGVVGAIGVIKMAWQGLTLLWEGAKIAVGALSIAFYEAAKAITKAAMWIGDLVGKVWDNISASFSVSKNLIVTGWYWIKDKALGAFSDIAVKFGTMIRSMGEAAAGSRIKGLADVGRAAQEAGGELIVGAVRLREGVKQELNAAAANLEESQQKLDEAKDAFSKPADLSTPWLDRMTDQAHNFFNTSVAGFKRISEEIASQEGGNAISAAYASYERSTSEMQNRVTGIVKDANKERALVTRDAVIASEKDLEDEFNNYKRVYDMIAQLKQDSLVSADKLTGGNSVEQAEYENKLSALKEFYDQRMITLETYQGAERELIAQHLIATASLENENQQTRMKGIVDNAGATYEQRLAAFDAIGKLEDDHYQIELDKAAAARDAGLITKSQYDAVAERMHEDHEMKMTAVSKQQADMRAASEQMVLGAMANMFGSFAASMDQKKRKEFNMWKVFSIAQATISTYLGATNAMASSATMGPAAAIAATAMVVAAGLANVAKIASTKFDGGGGGGGGGGGASSSAGATSGSGANTVSAGRSDVNVTLVGDRFTGNQVRGLISAINEQVGDNVNLKSQMSAQ